MPRSSGGYSCSVPATPEHRRYLPPGTDWASLSYAGHPGMPAHPAEFAMMRGRSRGVPYGYHPRNPRHPGPPTQGRMPFRHPSQYRSMPAHAAYGYYPRGRPRHMAPMYASSRLAVWWVTDILPLSTFSPLYIREKTRKSCKYVIMLKIKVNLKRKFQVFFFQEMERHRWLIKREKCSICHVL